MQDKWALEEHLSTPENNQLWDDSGEAARNGKLSMDYVESHLLDMDERIKIMDATGIERTIVSLTSPDIQSITDTGLAVQVARDTNDLVKRNFVDRYPDRLSMFACLPTQDGAEAAAELRRAVGELGVVGALINGYTNVTEGLPFLLPRLEHRLGKQKDGAGLGAARRKVSEYFSDNFYATTSGHFHTRTLFNTIAELGVDRVLFSADYPYETMEEAAGWFDNSLLSRNDAQKIGRDNARRLFSRAA
jgi:predicted TIM-barrel fold metal-dependent hydrolase